MPLRPTTALIATCLSLTGSAANAALPPYWQRAREIEAMVQVSAVVDAMANNAINRIEKTSPDHFRITAGPCHANIRLKSLPQDMPGPRKFKVVMVDHACAKE